ncbi:hypothetical protein GYMLUDRAFT_244676 [Collybiopsis luxurians FD-317 M1]|uniref:Unplaced genomic scaffold GYMLUscaffold_28, whole genome shotgun sequence n=1 Tax=Collybiopsis luxurians FD-317 M1 TaxID=944289 RepID=A0A0D0CCL7_9AGAR|nr:hypothetical protein GYMLUDRAFT_244676 [Collybiopsis luxurians FD-317 M1]
MFFNRDMLNLAFLALAVVSTPALGQQVNLNCLTSGRGGASDCSQFISNFCQSGTAINPVAVLDTYSRCYNTYGFSCVLKAKNARGNNPALPNESNCERVLDAVASGCPMGGHGNVDDNTFEFSLNPNKVFLTCGSLLQLNFVLLSLAVVSTPVIGQTANVDCHTAGHTGAKACSDFINNFCQSGAAVLPPSRILFPVASIHRASVVRFSLLFQHQLVNFINFPSVAFVRAGVLKAKNKRGNGASVPNESNCEQALNAIASQCSMGGHGNIDNKAFQFTLNPNKGNCV